MLQSSAQSAEDEKAIAMQQQVSELEVLVSAACAKGVEPVRCRDIIEDAVKRARRRGSMLPHLDSGLLISALEQTKSEIASLIDVTATNAEVMAEELLHHQEREEELAHQAAQKGTAAAAASVQTQPGASAWVPPSVPSVPEARRVRFEEDSRSVHSVQSSDAPGGGLAPHTPSTKAPSLCASLSAADVVAPMRDFASEVAAEVAAEADEDRLFRHSLSMKASKSGDFRLARAYDFETAQSPRASYHSREQPFAVGARSSLGGGGDPDAALMWPPAGVAQGQGPEEDERLLVYSRTPEGEPVSDEALVEGQEARQQPSVQELEAPVSPASAAPRPQRRHYGGGGEAGCSGFPPGLNPMAEVEGGVLHDNEREIIDPHSPTGLGELDLQSYSAAPFTLHRLTPPKHVMEELAAEVQGHLRP